MDTAPGALGLGGLGTVVVDEMQVKSVSLGRSVGGNTNGLWCGEFRYTLHGLVAGAVNLLVCGKPLRSCNVIGKNIKQDMTFKQGSTGFAKFRHGVDITHVHRLAGEKQHGLRVRRVVAVDGVVFADEVVVLRNDLSGFWIGKARVKTHRHSPVGGQLGNGRPCAGALVLAQREGFAAGGPAEVARLQRAFTQEAVLQVGVKCRAAGAVPEIVLVPGPEFLGQQAAFIAVNLVEISQMVPLPNDEAGPERPAVLHEYLVETFLGGHL